jgi:DNA-binding LacI/PurR family transcriptional regulator
VKDSVRRKGHKTIGYIYHSSIWINNFEERKAGYMKALENYGIKYDSKLVYEVQSTIEVAFNDMIKILSERKEVPAAIFCRQ